MFGFGNKKRIEELERQIGVLADEHFKLRVEEREVSPCKCESCGVNTDGETTQTFTILGHSTEYKSPIKISAAKAIEKIMDHLGLEFNHIEATNPDTVIKPKETP